MPQLFDSKLYLENFHGKKISKRHRPYLSLWRCIGPLVKGCRFGFRTDLQYEIIIFRTTFAGEGSPPRVREELTTTPKRTAKTNVCNLARFCNSSGAIGRWKLFLWIFSHVVIEFCTVNKLQENYKLYDISLETSIGR